MSIDIVMKKTIYYLSYTKYRTYENIILHHINRFDSCT
jgi:hypothetical protein